VAENSRVWRLRGRAAYTAQFFGKAQVEHAVGFVQHQGLHLVELHGVLAEQVEQAAGVATSRSTPRRRRIICGLMLTPPYTA
jgi:hypothetical protein